MKMNQYFSMDLLIAIIIILLIQEMNIKITEKI